VRKVICLVGYHGGFRNNELKSLTFENVECDEAGYFFSFARSKQRSKLELSVVCVPRRQRDWIPCANDAGRRAIDYDPASVIDAYFEAVMQDLNLKREELKGGLFKSTHGKSGKRFINGNIGKNTLANVGVEVATELCMRAPETFTGHCWRRSAGTNASNAGVNVTTLMAVMGWSCPKTAMQYVNKSRTTALQMSWYLANVQRANKRDPFPSLQRPSRKVKFSVGGQEGSSNGRSEVGPVERVIVEKEALKDEIYEYESSVNTQALLADPIEELDGAGVAVVGVVDRGGADIEMVAKPEVVVAPVSLPAATATGDSTTSAEAVSVTSTSAVSVPAACGTSSSVNLGGVDPHLLSFLQNLQNHGTVQIHFNFGDAAKR